ncbi:substrate-binding domain-containing protein [Bacillus sp. N9]
MKEAFSLPEPPTALFAGNDLVFLETLEAFKENQVKIGRDIALIVFDNIPFAHLVETPVTTIAQPGFEMGQKAAELLINNIENKEPQVARQYVFPCKLMVRASSQSKVD